MENNVHSDELQHHGTKGMRWGIRRYQNKDGSLTPAGQKRYNKEVEKLKAETAKVKAAEKVAANRAKTQSKLDKLEAKKHELEERKKALKGKGDNDADKAPEETVEQRRERVLKSTNPKEVYENRDVLTYNELNERVNRIDLEMRLQGKIPTETEKTGRERMTEWKNNIDTANNLFKSVDNAFSSLANSSMGKTLMKSLGIELGEPKKTFNYKEAVKKIQRNEATIDDIRDYTNAIKNINTINQQVAQIEKTGSNNNGKGNQNNQNQGKKDKGNKSQESQPNQTQEKKSKQKSSQEPKTETAKATSDSKQRNADVNDQMKKASDALKEATERQSKVVDRTVKLGDSALQDTLSRNNTLMSELDNEIKR